jgi:hypothetical protein
MCRYIIYNNNTDVAIYNLHIGCVRLCHIIMGISAVYGMEEKLILQACWLEAHNKKYKIISVANFTLTSIIKS